MKNRLIILCVALVICLIGAGVLGYLLHQEKQHSQTITQQLNDVTTQNSRLQTDKENLTGDLTAQTAAKEDALTKNASLTEDLNQTAAALKAETDLKNQALSENEALNKTLDETRQALANEQTEKENALARVTELTGSLSFFRDVFQAQGGAFSESAGAEHAQEQDNGKQFLHKRTSLLPELIPRKIFMAVFCTTFGIIAM